ERRLATIWAEALDLPEVAMGVRDDYFALGGTSLLAVAICARVERELGQRLPLTALLEHPTIEALAARIDGAAPAGSLVELAAGAPAAWWRSRWRGSWRTRARRRAWWRCSTPPTSRRRGVLISRRCDGCRACATRSARPARGRSRACWPPRRGATWRTSSGRT